MVVHNVPLRYHTVCKQLPNGWQAVAKLEKVQKGKRGMFAFRVNFLALLLQPGNVTKNKVHLLV